MRDILVILLIFSAIAVIYTYPASPDKHSSTKEPRSRFEDLRVIEEFDGHYGMDEDPNPERNTDILRRNKRLINVRFNAFSYRPGEYDSRTGSYGYRPGYYLGGRRSGLVCIVCF